MMRLQAKQQFARNDGVHWELSIITVFTKRRIAKGYKALKKKWKPRQYKDAIDQLQTKGKRPTLEAQRTRLILC